jgi:hypothetical protein
MSFFVNLGYRFNIASGANPDGSLILASAMAMHQLARRKFRNSHMEQRLFDPQLYLSALDVAVAKDHCAKLASYPWFNVEGLGEFQSAQFTQRAWMERAKDQIGERWSGNVTQEPSVIQIASKECVDFQRQIGCCGVILPSPLTVDPGTDYSSELSWLDTSLNYISSLEDFNLPVYATIALSDVCIRFLDPEKNSLLDLILDTVSARKVDGVYIIVEQASESDITRNCANSRALNSVLHLVHMFSHDAELKVGVNFVGAFGLACVAAGAEWWASNWYKSLYRVRLADKVAGGRAFPSYWTYPAACDVNLDSDFDTLVKANLLSKIADSTSASSSLLLAAGKGVSTSGVPAWAYRLSNVTAASEHYLLSVITQDQNHSAKSGKVRMDLVEQWLEQALLTTNQIKNMVSDRTRTDHIKAWRDAFIAYRKDHNV